MAVETADLISELNAAWPLGSDLFSEGDNHLRLIKAVLQGTFSDSDTTLVITKGGATFAFASDGSIKVNGVPIGGGSAAWADITGKPATFPPTLPIPTSGVTGLEDAMTNVSAALALRVLKAGDTMSGHLSLPTGPAAANAVRKDYVDAADATKIGDASNDGILYGRRNLNWVEILNQSSGTYQNYMFNATTASPPASGTVRFNNASQSAVTTIWFHYTTNDTNAVNLKTYWTQRVKAGDQFYFQDKDDPTKWQLYELNSAFTDSGTYATLAVTWKAGGSALTAARIIVTREGAPPPPVETAAQILAKLITVDGTGSNLDADLLDGNSSAHYLNISNITAGTLPNGAFTDTSHGARSGGNLHANAIAGSVAGFMSATDKSKLDGVATGATANSSDATLLGRANHTGTQTASTISDFSTAADARVALKITNKLTVASSAPSSPATNDIWIDTT